MEGNGRKENHSIDADILDDLAVRFIINMPECERTDLIRLCFQIELGHWFYLDFYCTNEDKNYRGCVPCGIKQFAHHIFNVSLTPVIGHPLSISINTYFLYSLQHIPYLRTHLDNLDSILAEWKEYKMSVPTYGAILMTADYKHVLLVQSYFAKNSWGFPKGKVNEKEEALHCAIREVCFLSIMVICCCCSTHFFPFF